MSDRLGSPAQEGIPALLRKAARERERGHFRRAMALYKRAAFDVEDRPGLWTRYALCCLSAGQAKDAAHAFSQAIWLFERQGRRAGAAVTRALAEIASSGQLPDNYARPRARAWRGVTWRAAVQCASARRDAATARQDKALTRRDTTSYYGDSAPL